MAVARGNTEVVETLLEWRVSVNVGDSDAKTPLMKVLHLCFKPLCHCRCTRFLSVKPDIFRHSPPVHLSALSMLVTQEWKAVESLSVKV